MGQRAAEVPDGTPPQRSPKGTGVEQALSDFRAAPPRYNRPTNKRIMRESIEENIHV